MRTLSPVGNIVPKLLDRMGITPKNYALLSLMEREISGMGSGAKLTGFKGNRLYVEVDSPSQYSDLSLRKREILRSIQRGAPDVDLSLLQIKVVLKGGWTKEIKNV